jgi:hypothetical protein
MFTTYCQEGFPGLDALKEGREIMLKLMSAKGEA